MKAKKYVDLELILMDRAFFNADVLEFLIGDSIPHIIPVRRNQKIESLRRAITLKRTPIPPFNSALQLLDFIKNIKPTLDKGV